MAEIRPFPGRRYAANIDYARVVTPPYDVIDPPAQRAFYERDPHSMIRLELGYEYPGDTPADNRYTRAAADYAAWQAADVLVAEAAPALYLYEEEFTFAGQTHLRTSFFAAVAVTDYGPGAILPHEHTLARPVTDRLQLLQACHANFSPIFGLYPDPEGAAVAALRRAASTQPDVHFSDDAGTRHRLWVVTDPGTLRAVAATLRPCSIYIADGHHRYETALRYHRENPEVPGSDRVLMVFTALTAPGLMVLPTHRVVANLTNLDVPGLLASLASDFAIEPWPGAGTGGGPDWVDDLLATLAQRSQQAPSFGLCTGWAAYLLTLQNPAAMAVAAPDRSPAWRRLDVAVLQTLVLEQRCGVGAAQTRAQSNLTYTRSPQEAVRQVQSGAAQLTFLMNPLPVAAVQAVADARDNMPQKSTYFYPKFLTGVVIHHLG